jgi:uncharacterized LabA/DUF88 family protein
MPTAVVIDGAFFLRRFSRAFPDLDESNPKHIAAGVVAIAAYHAAAFLGWAPISSARAAIQARTENTELYRTFFYDCPPLMKRVHRPISGRSLNLGTTADASLRLQVHAELIKARKVALRLGRLSEALSTWRARPEAVKRWAAHPESFAPSDDDFELDVVQKGVDMRLGLDVASMAFKKQVSRIILVAADADFVPPAKLARREGIDIVLDSMGARVAADLVQHVDGIRIAKIDRLFDGPF